MATDFINSETGTGAAGGAAQGAAVGTAVMPGWGTLIGAGAGAIVGGVSGSLQGRARKRQKTAAKKAHNKQKTLVQQEQGRRDANVGKVRDTFGILPASGEKNRDLGKTLTARSGIAGAIEQRADQASDAVTDANVAQSSELNQDVSTSLAQRGMLGSSVDDNARNTVLAGYSLGKSNAVSAASQTRNQGNRANIDASRPVEQQAATGQNINPQLRVIQERANLKQAQIGLNYSQYTDQIANALNTAGSMSKSHSMPGAKPPAAGPDMGGIGGAPSSAQPSQAFTNP